MSDDVDVDGPWVRLPVAGNPVVQVPVVIAPDGEVAEVIKILRGVTREDVGRVVRDYAALQAQMYRQFLDQALHLIRGIRPRHVGTVAGAMTAWHSALVSIARACEEHLAVLERCSGTSLEKVCHGDVRARFGRTQVYLDGVWYWLGSEVGGA